MKAVLGAGAGVAASMQLHCHSICIEYTVHAASAAEPNNDKEHHNLYGKLYYCNFCKYVISHAV